VTDGSAQAQAPSPATPITGDPRTDAEEVERAGSAPIAPRWRARSRPNDATRKIAAIDFREQRRQPDTGDRSARDAAGGRSRHPVEKLRGTVVISTQWFRPPTHDAIALVRLRFTINKLSIMSLVGPADDRRSANGASRASKDTPRVFDAVGRQYEEYI
jgi:hypothetical protein